VVRARRHFLKNIVTHIDTVCYVSRAAIKTRGGIAGDGLQPQAEEIAPPQLPPKAG
jgi:hypothetical protein